VEVSEPCPAAAFDVRSRSRAPLFVAAAAVLLIAFVLLIAGAPAVQRVAVTPASTLPAAPLGLSATTVAVRCGVLELAAETLLVARKPVSQTHCDNGYFRRP